MSATPAAANRVAQPDIRRKLEQIASRPGLTGFKGFCPVMLTDYRELVDAKLEFTTEYEGRRYWFSSEAARETFMLDPSAYTPARGGIDVVVFDRTGESREGSLDHAVWYRGQLYLFDSAETRAAFAAAPQEHEAVR
jgi:YHS domain-containing protein